MIQFTNNLRVRRPIDEVFAFLSDFTNIPKWNYYVFEVRKVSEGNIGMNTRFHQRRKTDAQTYRITEFEPPTRVSVKTEAGSSPAFQRMLTLKDSNDGTKIVDRWALETGRNRFVEVILSSRIKKAVFDNLNKLKELLERDQTTLQDGRTVRVKNRSI
jgi:hypothetical protein